MWKGILVVLATLLLSFLVLVFVAGKTMSDRPRYIKTTRFFSRIVSYIPFFPQQPDSAFYKPREISPNDVSLRNIFKADLTTYYVDAVNGNDSNPGTADKPLKTITSAVSKTTAGSAILVMKGDYTNEGIIRFSKTASEDDPFIITAQSDSEVIVRGFSITDSQWVGISGFKVVGEKELPPRWKDMPEVVIDVPSVNIDYSLDWGKRKNIVSEKYATYAEFFRWDTRHSSGIGIISSYKIALINNDVSLHTLGIQLGEDSSFVLVEGNSIHHNLVGVGGGKYGKRFSFSNSFINKNHVYQSFRAGINVDNYARDNVVSENLVEYSGHSHLSTYEAGDNNIFENNTARFGGYYTETMRYPGGSALSIHSAGKGTQVLGNNISYQYDASLRDGNGIILDINRNGVYAANNIIFRTQGSGITATKSSNGVFVHNTIIEPGYLTSSEQNGVGFRTSTVTEKNMVFSNNIVYNPSIAGMAFRFNGDGLLKDQKFTDNNLFYLKEGIPLVVNGKNIYVELADWQKTGYGVKTLVADPLFVNYPEDFHLKDNSPARGFGTTLYTLPLDKDGDVRLPPPTIGALE